MSEGYNPAEIEEKWLRRWGDSKVFESNPDKRGRFYLTVAYPYPSGGMHIGHARTYTVPVGLTLTMVFAYIDGMLAVG